jgi:signal transduction histidine kinase
MSLQEYAIHVSHAVRTALGNVKRMAGFFKKHYPNPKYENYFVKYSGAMYAELNNLSRAVDFMLSYAGSSADVQDFNVKELLNGLFNDTYGDIFKAEAIDPIVEIRDNFELKANRKFFEDIFENLISNSIKALKGRDEKIIKCTGVIERDVFSIYFSDNGVGVPLGDEERIFEMYYTTTANVGGAGLGLYIVRTRVESLGGKVFVADPEFTPGVTFRIDFPFNSK